MTANEALPRPFTQAGTNRFVFYWLVVIAAFVCAMILVGGATRLTDSGLSITEWKPVTGALPPLNEAGWHEEFEKYRAIPEYQLQNRGMSLSEFQFIYWWEWSHRQLGRTLGLVFALPFAVFMLRGMIAKPMRMRLWILFALGGLQGAIGWWMVSSGLVDRLDVSQYRLATHLCMAFTILGLTAWLAMDARYGCEGHRWTKLARFTAAFWGLIFLQVALGAFVAGLDAGRIYTTWPLMEGRLIPEGYLAGHPFFSAIFESRAAVQLHHRWTGYLALISGLTLAYTLWRSKVRAVKPVVVTLAALLIVQVVLGIVTLVHAAPLNLSLIHQGGAIALFLTSGVLTWTAHRST
ncbi:COX15/CtaA family protein [Woodsholea maritima]|uniref:COX15/CtaA family protein n=1 Tax=Woodsholea maritima TaxID=240237 RepID=UPI000361C23B|nr:COX15/CtaA family protein [Woodsholea maritima]